MVKEYVIFTIILAGLFSGCIGDESITGKYVSIESDRAYFILYEDNTFNEWFDDGTSASGAYRINENQLILTYAPFGNVRIMVKNGTAWDNDSGGKYAKK